MTPFAMRTLPLISSNVKPSLNTSRKSSVTRRGSACSDSTPRSLPAGPGSIFVNRPGPDTEVERAGERRVVELVRRTGPRELAVDLGRRALQRVRVSERREEEAGLLGVEDDVELRLLRSAEDAPRALGFEPSVVVREHQPVDPPFGAARSRDELEAAEIALLRHERIRRDVDLRPGIVHCPVGFRLARPLARLGALPRRRARPGPGWRAGRAAQRGARSAPRRRATTSPRSP